MGAVGSPIGIILLGLSVVSTASAFAVPEDEYVMCRLAFLYLIYCKCYLLFL